MKVEKPDLRERFQSARRSISPNNRHSNNQKIKDGLLQLDLIGKARVISSYVSLPEEVETKTVIVELLGRGKTVVVPRVEGGHLVLHAIKDLTDLSPGAFSIWEPKTNCPVIDVTRVEVSLVPGIAFDRSGNRLGWGKGYYDRLLKGTLAKKIGLAYSLQICAEIPVNENDCRMDIIITEKEMIVVGD